MSLLERLNNDMKQAMKNKEKDKLSFTDQELRLLLKQGQLLIKGKSFVIKTILPEEILLEGKIDQVIYLDKV